MRADKDYFQPLGLILFGIIGLLFGGIGVGVLFIIWGIYSAIVHWNMPIKIVMCKNCGKKYSIKMTNKYRVKEKCVSCGYDGWMKVIGTKED